MKMSEVAKRMSVREFSALCSSVDQKRPGAQFNVVRVGRRAKKVEVVLVLDDGVTVEVRVDMEPNRKALSDIRDKAA